MQFISILMLFGLLAVAIPIIIQILTRKNARKISWGAWLFLDKTMKKRKRKVLLEDILLLACRCLAVALLALAFARPFVRPDSPVPWAVTMPLVVLSVTAIGISFALWRYPLYRRLAFYGGVLLAALTLVIVVGERWFNLKRFGGGATKDIVLLLDGSASMSIVNDGKSNFERAIEEAKKYVELAPQNTSFAVILGGPVPQVVTPKPVSDKRVIMNALDRVHLANGTMEIVPCLTAAGVVLASGPNAVKQIVILGDGQTMGWHLEDRERWRTVQRTFRTVLKDSEPIITWRTLPLPASIRNLAIASVRPARDVVGIDREVRLDVTVVNAGTEAVTPKGVTLRVESDVLQAREVRQLEPGESQVFSFTHRFEQPGGTVLTAHVDAQDDLPVDDTYKYAMPVIKALRVLVVDGDPGADFMNRASTYVRLALRPQILRQVQAQAAAEGGAPDAPQKEFLISTDVEDITVAGNRTTFGGYSAVMLCGARRLSERTLEALAEFVRAGGGLFFMPAAASDAEAFNGWTSDGEPVLPARLGKWRENKAELDTEGLREMLQRFRTGTDLGSAAPTHVMEFGEGFASNAVVVARLTDETPLLLTRTFGAGEIVQSAVRFDPSSGLVTKRGFLPLMHEIAYSLARPASVTLDVRPQEALTLLVASGSAGGEAASESGLVGYYYPKQGLQGKPVVRIDKNIDFNWGNGAPMKDFPADSFSVKWRGVLLPPADGSYQFVMEVDDRLSVSIDGRRVGNWGKVNLTGGKPCLLEARYEEDWGVASCRLKWVGPGGRGVIPESALRTRAKGVVGAGELVKLTDPHGELLFQDGIEIFDADEGIFFRTPLPVVPGVYEISEIPDLYRNVLEGVTCVDGKIRFSVSSGVEESTMTAISQGELSDLGNYIQISQAIKDEDVLNAITGQSFGKEIWRTLAIFAFLFLVAEPAIARWIAINRRTGDIIDTEGSWIRT
ncbi:MAG: BatA domain-containing protein [Kiritimatiellae bacterium]|nr:BatA domain-containing protein [Kiritimatiellia bacterium]